MSCSSRHGFYLGWPTLVKLFLEIVLSFPKDRLYAVDGIARLIAERLDVRYLNSVFLPPLAQGFVSAGPFS